MNVRVSRRILSSPRAKHTYIYYITVVTLSLTRHIYCVMVKFMDIFSRYRHPFKLTLITVLAIAVPWAIYINQAPAKDSLWNYGYNLMNAFIYMIGGVAGLYYAISPRMPQDIRKGLMYLGLGELSWAMAAILWSYFNIFLHINEPYPSISDFFFIAFMVDISFGALFILKYSQARISRRIALEAIAIIVVTYIVTLAFVSPPVITPHISITTAMFNFIYPVGDAFILALALAIYRLGNKTTLANAKYLMIAFLLQTLGDFVFGYVTIHNTYWNGDMADIIYTLSGFALSAGIINLGISSSNVKNDPS